MENPMSGKTEKVAMSETGIAMSGIIVARQFWRKTKTTRITRKVAWNKVITISLMPSRIERVVSSVIR